MLHRKARLTIVMSTGIRLRRIVLQEAALWGGVVSIVDQGTTAFACHGKSCILDAIHLLNVIRWKYGGELEFVIR